ncbi:MAG: glycosyltransferase [Candidatus Zixiibacteriota bacterium]
MKILFLADARTYHTQRWVNYFVDRGHQCFFISLERGSTESSSDGGLGTKAKEFFVPPKAVPHSLKYALSLPSIRGIVALIQPDLVNAHFVPNYGLIGALLKFHPLVISTWGSDVLISPKKTWLHKKRAEYILAKADLVTADAMVTAEAACRLGAERGKVLVSPMGVQRNLIGRQKKSDVEDMGKKKPCLLVLSNRRLEPLYDVASLLKAVPLVMKAVKKDVRFVILGEGSEKEKLIHLTRRLGIESCVEFKGVVPRERLLQYYRDSDVYVSASKSDSTSVSLLEAMNFGLIPVVTDIPGNREWIKDQENGFLFATSDHKALANVILYVIDEFSHWAEFRLKNEGIIRSRAVWEDNMGEIEDGFRELVGRA